MESNRRRFWVLTAVLLIGTLGSSVRGQPDRQASILPIDTSTSMKQTPPGFETSRMKEVRRPLGDFAVNMPAGNRLTVFSFDQSPLVAGPDVAEGPTDLGSDTHAPGWRIVVAAGAAPPPPPKSWTRHLIWIVPLAILLMILLLLMRRTDDEEAR